MSNRSTGALGITAALLGWLFIAYGTLLQVGDPSPDATAEQLQRSYRFAVGGLFLGSLLAFTSFWLSGYLYSTSKAWAVAVAAVSLTCLSAFVAFVA